MTVDDEWNTPLDLNVALATNDEPDANEPDGWSADLDIEDLGGQSGGVILQSSGHAAEEGASMPPAGQSTANAWSSRSGHASDHLAAGSFETAMHLLHRQIAIVNFQPFQSRFVLILLSAWSNHTGLPLASTLVLPNLRTIDGSGKDVSMPTVPLGTKHLVPALTSAYKHFQRGSFASAKDTLSEILLSLPLIAATARSAVSEVS